MGKEAEDISEENDFRLRPIDTQTPDLYEGLDELKTQLAPVVFGKELVPLHDGYVPMGPETLSDQTSGDTSTENEIIEHREVPTNRYSGVTYAARFFVTRVGFLRSVKRIMVLSSHHLTIVDPYTDEVKERYAYDNIKEITVASDSGSNTVDKSFTIFIGKNIKETYTCRNRQYLLSAYYQLRERASSFGKEAMDVNGVGGGIYFDNLFQLCGKTYTMTKLSTTRSTHEKPVKTEVLLAVRAASLDRLDLNKRTTLSSILLIDIVKIQRVKTNSNELIIYYENNRVHRYWSDSREPFIQAIANNTRSWLNVSLFVEEVSDACEFDALTSTRDIPQPVSFEIPVLKISKNDDSKLQLRLLALTSNAVLERDPVTRRTLASHSLNDIYNVVLYPSMSSSMDTTPIMSGTSVITQNEGSIGKFALELKHGRTRRYVCVSCTVNRRDRDIGLGLHRVTTSHENTLKQIVTDISGEHAIPKWLEVAGATTILHPREARSLFLSNMMEMCRMNKLHVSWSTEETKLACKEGTWGTEIHPEWEDILLRKLVNLHLIPTLVTKDTLEQIFRQLEQFNRNVPIGGSRQRDRRAFTCVMKLLESVKEYCVAQLKSPSNSDCPVPTTEFQVALLLTLQRLLCTRGVFEEVPHSQYRNCLEIIMELLHSPMEEVCLAAAWVIKYMVINYSETRSMKSETSNRRAVFTRYHSELFVSRVFDLSKRNRIERIVPKNLLSQVHTINQQIVNQRQHQLKQIAEALRNNNSSGGSGASTSNTAHLSATASVSAINQLQRKRSVSVRNALSSSLVGLDYLVISIILQTLEVCLSSGKKATPERVSRELLRAMRIDEFLRHHALFVFNRSLSFSIAKCSSILVKVQVLEQPSELVELIQDFARKHGALLWQLYLALYAQDKAQRRISSQLVALLTHENPRSSNVIRSVFPRALLDDIPVEDLDYDEFGRHIPSVSIDTPLYVKGSVHVASGASPQKKNITTTGTMIGSVASATSATGISVSTTVTSNVPGGLAGNRKESIRGRVNSGLNTRSRVIRHSKCVVLLPEFFDRLWKSYSTKELIWGSNTVEELINKLEQEIAHLDLYRLRYHYYLVTDPLVVSKAEEPQNLKLEALAAFKPSTLGMNDLLTINENAVVGNEESTAPSLSFPFEFLSSGSDSRLSIAAIGAIAAATTTSSSHGTNNGSAGGAGSSSSRFAQYLPFTYLLTPGENSDENFLSGDEEGESDESDAEDDDENAADSENDMVRRGSKGRYRDVSLLGTSATPSVAATVGVGGAASAAAAAVSVATDEKEQRRHNRKRKKKAKAIPPWFVAWNANEFRIVYECLSDEVKVGAYYLTNILNDRGVLCEDIEDPERFMVLLYYRLLAEESSRTKKLIAINSPTGTGATEEICKSDIRLLVLKVMIQLYERHYHHLHSLLFLNHLIRVSMMKEGESSFVWPLVVRGNIVLFLDRVLSSAINVARFLREESNVKIILDLLEEVKPLIFQQGGSEIESEKGYLLDDGEEDQENDNDDEEDQHEDDDEDGSDRGEEEFDEEDLMRKTINALEESGIEDSAISNSSYAPSQMEDPTEFARGESSRFTVVAEHCGTMSGAMIMQTCLSVLNRLVDCHTSEDEGSLYHDLRFSRHGRVSHQEGSAVSPVTEIKHLLCEDKILRFLVSLLDSPNRQVFRKTLCLLRALVRHNEAIIPKLHATGLFYYLLRFSQDVDEMTTAARLFSLIHLRQTRSEEADAREDGSVFSPDPLTRICLKSWLVRLLPVSMVAQLLRHGPKRFAQALFADANNPEVVWNSKMRSQMVAYIEKFMARHLDNKDVFYISQEESLNHQECIALISYPKEVHALQCYQYYLHNLLDETHFPGWPINDEKAFLYALMESVHRWVHPSSVAKFLSVNDVIQLLDAVALLLRRFSSSPAIISLNNFVYILEALEKSIDELTEVASATPASKALSPARRQSSLLDGTSVSKKGLYLKALVSAIRVINLGVGLSEENAIEASSGLGLRVLCGALELLFTNQKLTEVQNEIDIKVTSHWVLEALVCVLNQPNGRVSAAAQSLDLLPCLTYFLSAQDDLVATDLSIQIIYEMAGSSGEMAEVLLQQLAEHGIVWHLSLLLFHYDPNAGSDQNESQRISVGAAKALDKILRASASEETIVVYVKRLQETIDLLFTRPLIDLLRSSGPLSFLQVFVGEVRLPHMMWTDRMRKELKNICDQAIGFHTALLQSRAIGHEKHQVYELPTHFMYAAQKEELCVAGIYVNFLNENPQAGIQTQIPGTSVSASTPPPPAPETLKRSSLLLGGGTKKTPPTPSENQNVSARVMHGLLTSLSHDIAGVRAQPQVLDAILLQRLLPVATAIRHLIQFTPDMDIQVVQSDGILTLLYALDHEAQPQAFSFTNTAPLLQLRCIECLQMLSFSGKCIETLAKLVPPFVRSAFQLVYQNLSKTDASTEGQLARITLQFLGHLCLVPACIDNLVKGMDPSDLANLLPQIWLGDPNEMQLLLCLHMIPLKRHTQAATQFAKNAIQAQLANALLNLLSQLVPKSKLGESSLTKSYAARFLAVLSSNPGSGGAISSMLIASRVWETHGETAQGSSDDLKRLLVPPHAPSIMKSDHANPYKIGY